MLILTRRRGQAIFIGNDIEIRFLGIVDNHVRIGIEAPKNIAVHREEIKRKIEGRKNNG
jgi:carbon storage regulator (csrA)